MTVLSLGIETSGRPGTVALCRDGDCLVERELSTSIQRRRHEQSLVAEIDRLFRQHSLRPADCNVVSVSIGPGNFTGLRIGVVFAKTFAYATGCALACVDTYQAIAENSPPKVDDLFVVGDALRGDLYVGHYVRSPDGAWQITELGELRPIDSASVEPQTQPAGSPASNRRIEIVPAAEWFASRSSTDVVSGPGIDKIALDTPPVCRLLGMEFRQPRASVVAMVGSRQVSSGQVDDLWSAEPKYVRRSAAEEKLDKGKSGSAESSASGDPPAFAVE